jgi:hypothetical protein
VATLVALFTLLSLVLRRAESDVGDVLFGDGRE